MKKLKSIYEHPDLADLQVVNETVDGVLSVIIGTAGSSFQLTFEGPVPIQNVPYFVRTIQEIGGINRYFTRFQLPRLSSIIINRKSPTEYQQAEDEYIIGQTIESTSDGILRVKFTKERNSVELKFERPIKADDIVRFMNAIQSIWLINIEVFERYGLPMLSSIVMN